MSTIGRGGMGVVARAVDELLNREVAVKILRAFTDTSAPELADLRARMQREAQAAARVRHNSVVTVHDVTEDQGLPVIVMELVDGPSLDAVLAERGTLEPQEAAAIGAELMDALDAAHRAGVLHRDVKPGNVLLENGGRVVLTDFGIATMDATGDETFTKLTRSGDIVGSLDFLPPERAQGREPGPASDIWSLGMTLYAAVEGSSPFRRTSVWSTLSAIVTEALPEPRRAGPLAPVLRALMAKEPGDRPDAAQARAMLARITDDSTTRYAALPSAPAPASAAAPEPTSAPVSESTSEPTSGPTSGPELAPTPPGFGPPPAPGPFQQGPAQIPQHPHAHAPYPHAYPAAPPGPGGPVPGAAAGGARSRADRARRRNRTVIAAAVAVVLAGGGVTYALTSQGGSDDDRATAAGPSPTAGGGGQSPKGDGASEKSRVKKSPSATPSPSASDERPSASTQPSDSASAGRAKRRDTAKKPGGKASKRPVTPTPQPTSTSESCGGWSHRNPRPGTYGYMSGSYHIVAGPYQKCAGVALAKSGAKLWYHCSVVNAHGHNWTYVRLAGTNTAGWMSNDNLTRQTGASTRC